jgi:hypothetical protein
MKERKKEKGLFVAPALQLQLSKVGDSIGEWKNHYSELEATQKSHSKCFQMTLFQGAISPTC